jgi:hypothetical protein
VKHDNNGYLVADSIMDWGKYQILFIEPFKEGFKRVHAKNGENFYLIYCKDEFLPYETK